MIPVSKPQSKTVNKQEQNSTHTHTPRACGFSLSAGLKSSSSRLMAVKSPMGSGEVPSMTWISARQRWTCWA